LRPSSSGRNTAFTPLINRLDNRDNRIIKRIFDIVGASFGILFLSPLLVFVAIIIKLSDLKSPLFFTQKRTGYNQKEFNCYKFRSMQVVDKSIADSVQATKDDPRITPLGSFLRRTNIDELPQLINVLKGEMSLIGPRPHPIKMNELQGLVPDYLLRHFVIPGITGWAQVNGWRGITDTKEKIEKRVEFDLWYVENWSLWLDIKILWLTIFSKKSYKNAV
jgi:putative colanic acid biosynthesis UDP-glucose lipid carrier transferase